MVRGSKQLLTAAMLVVSIFAVSINANDNVYNVSALYEKKSTLKGKTVKVKGTVLKITRAIMRKDWITISDNSSFQGKDSIIFTSTSAVAQNLKIGDKVTAEGILELDLDLGFPGYQYPVIVQNSKFSK
ncbi:MAG: hypothetical protein KAJ49_10975 [Arcobacteraceae bacterium]|nr:hypothetical protein [Arcobacteraceae bacterium]